MKVIKLQKGKINMANVKQITLDKTYNYIEYEDGTTTTDTIKLTIDDDTREFLSQLTGFMGEMLNPKNANEMTIVNVQVPIKGEITAICIPNKKSKLTTAGRFMKSVRSKLENIDYKKTNSLQEIYDNPEYDLNFILEEYVNPKCVNDTGVYLNNKMIGYEEKVFAKKDSIQKIIDYLIEMKEDNKVYKNAPITNMKFKLNKPNPFNLDVDVTFEIYGETYNYIHDNVTTELGRVPTKEEYDEYLKQYEIETLHSYAVDLNKKLNRRNLNEKQRGKRVNNMIESYEREMKESKDGQFPLYISYPLLNKLIEMNVIDERRKVQWEL